MTLKISKYSKTPLYMQLREEIKDKIVTGEYKPGDKIPTEEELCRQYAISRSVCRQAIMELVSEGYLERKQKKGTIVKQNRHTGFFKEIISFNAEMQRSGYSPRSVILHSEFTSCPEKIASLMGVQTGQPVIHIDRLRYRNDEVVYYVNAYYNPEFLPDFITAVHDNDSFYDVMNKKYDIKISRVHRYFKAITCSSKMAEILNCKPGAALAFIESREYDQYDRFIGYDESFYVGENSEFDVEVIKNY